MIGEEDLNGEKINSYGSKVVFLHSRLLTCSWIMIDPDEQRKRKLSSHKAGEALLTPFVGPLHPHTNMSGANTLCVDMTRYQQYLNISYSKFRKPWDPSLILDFGLETWKAKDLKLVCQKICVKCNIACKTAGLQQEQRWWWLWSVCDATGVLAHPSALCAPQWAPTSRPGRMAATRAAQWSLLFELLSSDLAVS